MLDIETLLRIDTGKMHAVYDRWPEIGEEQFNTDLEPFDCVKPGHIVFAGMGGSGAIGDLFASILSQSGVHVDVVKGYQLPKTADSDSLVVATSISGNTSETITVLNEAVRRECRTVSFSEGGRMKEMCNKRGIEFCRVRSLHSPRASFTSFLYTMIKVLNPVMGIDEAEIARSLESLKKTREEISSYNLSDANPALSLAAWMPEIPVVYYPWGLESAAVRFKNSLQENAKMHVVTENVIEACHNGVVSWRGMSTIKPIMIRGVNDHVKTKERWGILKEFFESWGIEYKEIFSASGGILTKLINLIYLFDYTSIYKAAMDGIDPTPVDAIEFIKKRIQDREQSG